jgi:hypothetical protein
MVQLYGTWKESFGQLFIWKVEVMRRMPNSVVGIDVELKDDMPYFRIFLERCRSYLSRDSTTLNGRSNGHLVAVCSVDFHN